MELTNIDETGVSCPISGVQVDEKVVRLIAAQVLLIGAVSVITSFYWLTAFLVVDFFTRSFLPARFSLLRLNAVFLKNTLGLSAKPTDEAPKLFAARMGFSVVLILLASQFLQLDLVTWILGGMLVFFAFLESALAVCVGCIVYQQLVSLKLISPESL